MNVHARGSQRSRCPGRKVEDFRNIRRLANRPCFGSGKRRPPLQASFLVSDFCNTVKPDRQHRLGSCAVSRFPGTIQSSTQTCETTMSDRQLSRRRCHCPIELPLQKFDVSESAPLGTPPSHRPYRQTKKCCCEKQVDASYFPLRQGTWSSRVD